jgi:hypothetical protein
LSTLTLYVEVEIMQMFRSLIFYVTLCLVFGVELSMAAVPLAPIRLKIEADDRYVVKGYRGRVEFESKEGVSDVIVTVHEVDRGNTKSSRRSGSISSSEDWQVSVRREGHLIVASVEGPTSKQVWNELLMAGRLSSDVPEYVVSVVGPSRPLDVSWHEGPIKVDRLDAELHVTSVKSAVEISQGRGDTTLSLQEGDLQVKNRKGPLSIESYAAKVTVSGVEGPLHLENFAGETNLHGADGPMDFMAYKGPSKLSSLKGRLDYKNGIGPLHIEKFEGELRGNSSQGAVTAEILGEADVRLQSADGSVTLHLPSGGAWVNLVTTEGNMAVPSYLKATRLPTQTVRSGRLKGSLGGSVSVRTTTGEIRIR